MPLVQSLRLLRGSGNERPDALFSGRLGDYALGVLAIIGRVCWLTLCCAKKSTGNVDVGGKGVG